MCLDLFQQQQQQQQQQHVISKFFQGDCVSHRKKLRWGVYPFQTAQMAKQPQREDDDDEARLLIAIK